VDAQLKSVLSDYEFAAIKTGMIPSAAIIDLINQSVPASIPLVVDPVMISTSGDSLAAHGDGWFDSMSRLLSRAHLVTPNLFEAASLALCSCSGKEEEEEVARKIAEIHRVKNVLVKGGHSENPAEVVDVLYADGIVEKFTKDRIESQNTHGTGCTLSAAIAANTAKGYTIQRSVAEAKDYVHSAILHGYAPGRGKIGVLEFSNENRYR